MLLHGRMIFFIMLVKNRGKGVKWILTVFPQWGWSSLFTLNSFIKYAKYANSYSLCHLDIAFVYISLTKYY